MNPDMRYPKSAKQHSGGTHTESSLFGSPFGGFYQIMTGGSGLHLHISDFQLYLL